MSNCGVFTTDDLAVLKKYGAEITYPSGSMIFKTGEVADTFYVVLKGRVRAFFNSASGREVTMDVMEPGHIFGETSFEENGYRKANIQAVNEVTVLCVENRYMEEIFAAHPSIARKLLWLCSEAMNHLSRRLVEQCTLDRFGKVAAFILDVTEVDSEEKGTKDGRIPYSHEELSTALGLSRSTVTTILGKFEDNGWIQKHYRYLILKDRKGLQAFAEDLIQTVDTSFLAKDRDI